MSRWDGDVFIPPPIQFGNIPFSPHHPYFNGMGRVESSSFVDEVPHPSFNKLSAWLKKHKEATKYCYFYVSNQQVNSEFRYFGLKSQIIEGLHTIGKLDEKDKIMTTKINKTPQKFPFSQFLIELLYVKQAWHTMKLSDYLTKLLKCEANKILKERYQKQKVIAENLESFISSIDAIPVNYFPIIDFKAIENDTTNIKNERLNQIRQHIVSIQGEYRLACVGIESCEQKYTQLSEIQETYKILIKKYAMAIDNQAQIIKYGTDTSDFHDIILHPNSPTYKIANEFLIKKDKDSFWALLNETKKYFNTSEADAPIVYALFTAEFAPMCSPEIKFDGSDIKFDESVLEIVCTLDPAAIISCMNNIGVDKSVESLKCLTSDWHKLLKFAIDFTDESKMPAIMKDTRKQMFNSMNCLI